MRVPEKYHPRYCIFPNGKKCGVQYIVMNLILKHSDSCLTLDLVLVDIKRNARKNVKKPDEESVNIQA